MAWTAEGECGVEGSAERDTTSQNCRQLIIDRNNYFLATVDVVDMPEDCSLRQEEPEQLERSVTRVCMRGSFALQHKSDFRTSNSKAFEDVTKSN